MTKEKGNCLKTSKETQDRKKRTNPERDKTHVREKGAEGWGGKFPFKKTVNRFPFTAAFLQLCWGTNFKSTIGGRRKVREVL